MHLIDVSGVFGDESGKYLPDGIHPNSEGHKLIFEKVKQSLESKNLI